MAAAPDPRSRRRAETRAEILDAAWHLAERDGIAALSLRELAAQVGMRAPSLYTYFPSKAAIYDEMFAAGFQALDTVVARVGVDPRRPVDSVAAQLEAFVSFCQASVPRYQLLFTRAVPGWQPSTEAYAVSQRSFARMQALLTDLGITHPDHLDLLTAIGSGLAAQQLANDPDGDRWRRRCSDAARMFIDHMSAT